METELNVRKNERNGGEYCEFKYRGVQYFADKIPCALDHHGPETMIFEKYEDGEVDWGGVYTDRTDKPLVDCIKEFIEELDRIAQEEEYLARDAMGDDWER